MADPRKVARALKSMAAVSNRRFKDEEEEQMAVAAFANAVKSYSDDAVNLAANEWVQTMAFFPKLVEFADLVRKHERTLVDRRALSDGGMAPMFRAPVGKPGSEGIATQIVLQRMFDAVAREAPDGFLGRARGLRSEIGFHRGLRDLGHVFTASGEHASDCPRCVALAAVAFEQAVDFEDSLLTDEMWENPVGDLRLRACQHCEYGWQTVMSMERGRQVERLTKCDVCGGPKPKVATDAKAKP